MSDRGTRGCLEEDDRLAANTSRSPGDDDDSITDVLSYCFRTLNLGHVEVDIQGRGDLQGDRCILLQHLPLMYGITNLQRQENAGGTCSATRPPQ
jgi:hypothetical protein